MTPVRGHGGIVGRPRQAKVGDLHLLFGPGFNEDIARLDVSVLEAFEVRMGQSGEKWLDQRVVKIVPALPGPLV